MGEQLVSLGGEVPGLPEAVGLSSPSLAIIDAHLKSYVSSGRLPGALVLVARNGVIAHLRAFGFADRENLGLMRPDSIFRIYSMTKPVTAVALMQLCERGKVQLDDPVDRYIGSWRHLKVYESGSFPDIRTEQPTRAMTIRDLLSHQSGLAYGLFDDSPVDRAYEASDPMAADSTLEDMVGKLAHLPLKFSPGQRWNYSISSDVAGYLVQLLSGQPFDEYLADKIFEPLGMNDTAFWVSPDRLERLAANYRVTSEGHLELADDPRTTTLRSRPSMLSGGGGLTSTAIDYWRFAQALCNGGSLDGSRIIGRKTLELMTSNHLLGNADLASVAYGKWSETAYNGIGFGLGFAVTLDPVAVQVPGTAGEFFWGGMASTFFLVDPREQLVLVFMTQLMPSSAYNLRRELRTLLYGALL